MGEKIASQLQEILNRLMSVETRLQKIEELCEKISNLEKAVSKTQTELNSLHEKAIVTDKKVGEVEKGMEFANAEIEKREKKEEEIAAEMKELKDGILYQETYIRRENLRFFGIPEDKNGDENTRELLYKFFSDELNIENSDSIDFQRVHRLGRKKPGQPRPIIARFLRFPDREKVFKSVLELGEDTDVKVYPDYPDEIRERRRKQWPRMKKAREEGKTAYFSCASGTRLSSKPNTGRQLQSFSGDDCGKTKGCYFKPESCNNSPNDCDYFVSYTPKGSSFSFELSGKEKWIAVGFNYKPTMDGTDGFICSALPNGSLLFGHYPVIEHKTPIRTKKVIKELKLENISQEGGVIKCRFSRQKTSSMMAVDLNKDLYLIFASGPVEKDGTLHEHRWFSHSMSPVNLEEIEILEASPYDLIVIQLHAVLLVFAWVGFATMGMFIARFMKPVWGEKEICSKRIWFVVHITIMLLTALLTIFGTSLAFLYVGSWSEDAGAHPFIGVIVLVIAVLQPLIAFFRPPVNAGRRRVLFNWVHRAVGLIALSLAVTNIFLGCLLPVFHLENSAVYVMLVYLLAIAGIVSFELYLTLCTKSDIDDFRVLSRPDDDEVEVAVTPRRHNTGDIRKRWRLHNFVFGLLILVIIIVCLAMAVLLAGLEEADNDENDD